MVTEIWKQINLNGIQIQIFLTIKKSGGKQKSKVVPLTLFSYSEWMSVYIEDVSLRVRGE